MCINTTLCGDRKTSFICFTSSCRENGVLIVIIVIDSEFVLPADKWRIYVYRIQIRYKVQQKTYSWSKKKYFIVSTKKHQFKQINCFSTEQFVKYKYVYS